MAYHLHFAKSDPMKPSDSDWPQPTTAAATKVMQANRGRDTAPELAVRSLLHARGLRFRTRLTIKLRPPRWTRPDIAFTRARVAVYIDGCFWHGCPEHGTHPAANASYWTTKLGRNVARDRDTDEQLAERGWVIIRAWEHEDAASVADRVAATVADRRP